MRTILIFFVLLIIVILLAVYLGNKTKKYSYNIMASNDDKGIISEDGKKITWTTRSGITVIYTRLAPIKSDPTNINDGNYVVIENGKTPTGAEDNLVNWNNDNSGNPVKFVTIADGFYKVYQNNNSFPIWITNLNIVKK